MTEKKIMVSVCMITYNHENFIKQAIEGVLMQKCDFSIQLIIGEDSSKDRTRDICLEFASKHHEIQVLQSVKNIGAIPNFIKTLQACTGKYIAICEGDDFWTDPEKLNTQVAFMESNPEYSLCFHNAIVKREGKKGNDFLFCKKPNKFTHNIYDAIKGIGMPTASLLFRKASLEIPEWLFQTYNGDLALQLILAKNGSVGYIDEIMSVYRIQPGGFNATMKNAKVQQHIITLLCYFNYYTNFKYSKSINEQIEKKFIDYPYSVLCDKSRFERLLSTEYWKRRIRQLKSSLLIQH